MPDKDSNDVVESTNEWPKTSDEKRKVFLVGNTFGPKEIECSVANGLLFFEGDICLGLSIKLSFFH
jgi:hypothetical protein